MKQTSPYRLEDNSIWRSANELAELMYDKAGELPDEEKWQLAHKLRSAANDLLFFAAQALGSSDPLPATFEWAHAHKYAFALKTMYRFAARRNFIELEPAVMVQIDQLIKHIDAELAKAKARADANAEKQEAKDLKPWLKKYQLWKQINGGK
jgi:hypothetical protein